LLIRISDKLQVEGKSPVFLGVQLRSQTPRGVSGEAGDIDFSVLDGAIGSVIRDDFDLHREILFLALIEGERSRLFKRGGVGKTIADAIILGGLPVREAGG
jgi:hypothetical protein